MRHVERHDEPAARRAGLELGADEYVGKPVDPRELEARIRAVLRRTAQQAEKPADAPVVEFAGMKLDIAGARLEGADGAEVPLTAMEFALQATLVKNRGRVLSRDQLPEQAHDRDWAPCDRSNDLCISRLRRKIGAAGEAGLIRTVRGIGYVFDAGG